MYSGTAIFEEDHLIQWEFAEESNEDEDIRNALQQGTISHGGTSNPADISFVGHQKQIKDFIHAIETDGMLLVDGKEGRKSVEIVCSIYEST